MTSERQEPVDITRAEFCDFLRRVRGSVVTKSEWQDWVGHPYAGYPDLEHARQTLDRDWLDLRDPHHARDPNTLGMVVDEILAELEGDSSVET